jgi:hypothetical protein
VASFGFVPVVPAGRLMNQVDNYPQELPVQQGSGRRRNGIAAVVFISVGMQRRKSGFFVLILKTVVQ